MNADDRYIKLEEYAANVESYSEINLSESDTRSKFLDYLMTKVFGWPEPEIRREKTYVEEDGKKAIDYEIGLSPPFLLIEAKKLPIEFELPTPERHDFCRSLKGVIKSCPNLNSAILQAREYCDDQGIPFAMVTNGKQFGLFRAISEGAPWREGNIVIFDLHTLKRSKFSEVHSALSYETCSAKSIDRLLRKNERYSEGTRLADDSTSVAGRFSNNMLDVISGNIAAIFQDTPDPDRVFLEDCYVTDTTRTFYSNAFQALLSDPLPVFAKDIKRAKPGHKKDPFVRNLSSNLSRAGTRPPTLLIGGKGFGKTTFLNWALKVNESKVNLDRLVIIWIDFKEIEFPSESFDQDLKQHLTKELSENPQLGIDSYSKLKAVFKKKLDREILLSGFTEADEIKCFERTCIGNWRAETETYLDSLVSYAQDHSKKTILIILDNADQKEFSTQKKVFEFANQICTRYPVSIVASLRESSYFRLCQTRTADAFSQQQVFHIQAPTLKFVLEQRFKHLSKIIKEKAIEFESASGAHIKVKDLSNFIDLLKRSLLESKDSARIQLFLSAMSNGSIRHSFQMIYDFLTSGHSKMETYFWDYTVHKKNSIPFHEFFASVLLDGMGFFSERNSHMFLNIYARSGKFDDSHFTRLRILKLTESLSTSNSFKPEDFVKIEDIRTRFLKIGVSKLTLEGHLKALLRFGLLTSDTQQDVDDDTDLFHNSEDPISIHLTACGKYYLDNIYSSFEYLSRIIPDTQIFCADTYTTIHKAMHFYKDRYFDVPLHQSVNATQAFFDYLKTEEQKEIKELALRDPLIGNVSFMHSYEDEFKEQIDFIRKRDRHNRSTPN
jgi:hypothetical protein